MKKKLCSKFKQLQGCGNCIISLNNTKQIRKLSPICMNDICDILLSSCDKNNNSTIDIAHSSICCNGDISLVYIFTSSKENSIIQNRKSCKDFIESWYIKYKTKVYESLIILYISRIYNILNSNKSENELLNAAMQLDRNINNLINDTI